MGGRDENEHIWLGNNSQKDRKTDRNTEGQTDIVTCRGTLLLKRRNKIIILLLQIRTLYNVCAYCYISPLFSQS